MKHRLQKRPYRVHLALWVDCRRLAIAFINASFALCVQYWREWSSNKRSNLFVTQFNVRVNWNRPQPGWGTNRAIKASHGIFMHYFRFSKKCYVDLCFMWNPWINYRPLVFWTEVLVPAWFNLFAIVVLCRTWFIWPACKEWLFRCSRANWPTTVSLTFQLLKVQRECWKA